MANLASFSGPFHFPNFKSYLLTVLILKPFLATFAYTSSSYITKEFDLHSWWCCLEILASAVNKDNLFMRWKVEKPGVTGNQTYIGLLAWAVNALLLSYDNWTTTSPHNLLHVPQSHTWWLPACPPSSRSIIFAKNVFMLIDSRWYSCKNAAKINLCKQVASVWSHCVFVLGMRPYLVLGSVDLVNRDVPVGLDAWWIKHSQEKPVLNHSTEP